MCAEQAVLQRTKNGEELVHGRVMGIGGVEVKALAACAERRRHVDGFCRSACEFLHAEMYAVLRRWLR